MFKKLLLIFLIINSSYKLFGSEISSETSSDPVANFKKQREEALLRQRNFQNQSERKEKPLYELMDPSTISDTIYETSVAMFPPTLKEFYDGYKALPDPRNNPDKRRNLYGNVLVLLGPPGCGKSTMGKCIAKGLNRKYLFIRCADVATKYQNSGSENFWREVEQVISAEEPGAIILDEVDALMSGFNNENAEGGKNAQSFQGFLDKVAEERKDLVVCTLNDPENLTNPVVSRSIRGGIIVNEPTSEAKKMIVERSFCEEYAPITPSGERELIYLIDKTTGMSLRAFDDVYCFAGQESMKRPISDTSYNKITIRDIDAALQRRGSIAKAFKEEESRVPENRKLHEDTKNTQIMVSANNTAQNILGNAEKKQRKKQIKSLVAENTEISKAAVEILLNSSEKARVIKEQRKVQKTDEKKKKRDQRKTKKDQK